MKSLRNRKETWHIHTKTKQEWKQSQFKAKSTTWDKNRQNYLGL